MGRSLNSAEAGMCRHISPWLSGCKPLRTQTASGAAVDCTPAATTGFRYWFLDTLSLDTGFSLKTHVQFHHNFTGIKETRRKKQKEGKNQLNLMYGFSRERLSSRSERYATPPPSEIGSLFIIFKVSQEGN